MTLFVALLHLSNENLLLPLSFTFPKTDWNEMCIRMVSEK